MEGLLYDNISFTERSTLVANANYDHLKVLITFNCDITLRNSSGYTALDTIINNLKKYRGGDGLWENCALLFLEAPHGPYTKYSKVLEMMRKFLTNKEYVKSETFVETLSICWENLTPEHLKLLLYTSMSPNIRFKDNTTLLDRYIDVKNAQMASILLLSGS